MIAIFSDTHDNLPNFKKAVGWVKRNGIKTIIHCGDIAKLEILREILKDYNGELHFVIGNMDDKEDFTKEKLEKAIFYKTAGIIEKNGKKIAFCHFPSFARKLALGGKYDIVFYGHTHQPWESKIGKCKVVNPGNLAGLFYQATFAVYDFRKDKLELKILSNVDEKS